MFTELKKGRWNYMLMAAIASIALAAITSLLTPRSTAQAGNKAHFDNEQVNKKSAHAQYNQSTVRFIN